MLMKNIQSLRIKIILLLSILIISITLVISILYIQNLNKLVDSNINLFSTTLISKEKKELRNKIDLATNILHMYYKQTKPKYIEMFVKKTLISHQQQLFSQLITFYKSYKDKYNDVEMKNHLKFLVRNARYGKNGYFWINDTDCKMIMHPIKPEYDGKIFKDTPKVPFVSLGVENLKDKKEAFIKYKFYNPATKKYEFKVSLVKIFEPFNWIIGTGQYLSDITPVIKKRALDDIEALRYGKNGYFWINDINYKMIMHPIRPEYDGKIFKDTPKVPFVQLGVEELKNAYNDIAVIRYVFYNPATKKYEDKLSIVKLFKPWNWIIGTGVYLNSIDDSIKKVAYIKDTEEKSFIYKIIILAIFVILTTIFISYYLIVNFIVKPVKNLNDEKEHFEEISQIDYLTQILNRRAFFDEVNKYFAYAKRNNIMISMLTIDIDFFKKINDTYGHEAGDEVLKRLSKIIRECIREEDIFGRLGGEEFAICVLNSNETIVSNVAEKIRKSIEDSFVVYKANIIKYSISIGSYTTITNDENLKDVLDKSNLALFKAKESGRNRVEIYNQYS